MRISDWSSDVCSSDLEKSNMACTRATPYIPAMFDFSPSAHADKAALHEDLLSAADALTAGEADAIAHMANVSALIWQLDRKSTRLNSSHSCAARLPSSA